MFSSYKNHLTGLQSSLFLFQMDVNDVILVFFVNFEHIPYLLLVFLLLTLNK